ncbi:MAG: hypothetical protein IAE80_27040 [Anaerolinea sp.]|nr:hypothetical protein [Anaerolinea sp.]
MTNDGLSQLLILYGWFPLAALILILLLIGRLYEKLSGERTGYRLFVIPLVLFGFQAVLTTNKEAGAALGGVLAFLGGISLLILCMRLYRKMMSHV